MSRHQKLCGVEVETSLRLAKQLGQAEDLGHPPKADRAIRLASDLALTLQLHRVVADLSPTDIEKPVKRSL